MTAVTLTAIALTGETLQRGISRGRSVAGSQGVVIEKPTIPQIWWADC